MVKVLVVDDSKVAAMLLVHILESDPQIRVLGAVTDGLTALDFVREHKPDVVLMDIYMPRMDGFEATRLIMETAPVPIVVCSAAANATEVATVFRAIEAGALACVEKPPGHGHPQLGQMAAHLCQTVKLMSEVKVVRRWPRTRERQSAFPELRCPERKSAPGPLQVIGIGASTGGPQVLQEILMNLPKGFGIPILVVQHIARGFLAGLAEWLNQTTGFQTHIGAYGVTPRPGHVYLAPDDFQMGVSSGRILLTREAPENHVRPAVSFLFRSLAAGYGPAAMGILLSGMGTDGAAELKLMKDSGAVTIAQDQESSVVHGMPGEAVRLGGATHVVAADQIASRILHVAAEAQRAQRRG